MKKIGWLVLAAVVAVSAVYMFRHLARWEWHRAMFAGLSLLTAEIALVGAVVVRAVRRAVDQQDRPAEVDDRVVQRLRESRPPAERVFAWLKPENQGLNVFVSILLGGGVLVSAAAWALDKIAKATVTGGLEHRLAGRLAALQPPRDGLVMSDEMLAAAGQTTVDGGVSLLTGPSTRTVNRS